MRPTTFLLSVAMILGITQVANAGVCASVDLVMAACCCDDADGDGEHEGLPPTDSMNAGCCCEADTAPGASARLDLQLPAPIDNGDRAVALDLPVAVIPGFRAALTRRAAWPQACGPPRADSLLAQHTLLLC